MNIYKETYNETVVIIIIIIIIICILVGSVLTAQIIWYLPTVQIFTLMEFILGLLYLDGCFV